MKLEYFQMVDRVVDVSLGDGSIRVESVVPMASTVFEGHFPGHPLVPGVLLIETMAQTAGWIVLARNRFDRMPFLAGVRGAKLRRFVLPGERLSVEGRILHEGSGFTVASCHIQAESKAVCDAELTFRILPFPNREVRADLEAAAARIGFPLEALNHAG
jgi:3-hydroxyacyl-[acyl-carrier-protein] dehydratase